MSTLKHGARRRRLLRKAGRPEAVSLNLVSMIDVLTVLLFFLLLTSSSVQTLTEPRTLKLPRSLSMQPPQDAAVVTITRDQILFQGVTVMSVAEASALSGDILPALKAQLLKVQEVTQDGGKASRGQINVMADQDVPFGLLKKVMATCGGSARFSGIALAVRHGNPGT